MATIKITLAIDVNMDADDVVLTWNHLHNVLQEGAYEAGESAGAPVTSFSIENVEIDD